MKVNNPYLNSKRILLLSVEKEEDPEQKKQLQEKLDDLLVKEKQWIHEQLAELSSKIQITREKLDEVTDKIKFPTQKTQYNEAVRLYREIVGTQVDGKLIKEGLIHKARQLKRLFIPGKKVS